MAGHQGMPHGMPMSHANQIPSSAATGMSQIPGPQMSQPQKMIPSPQVQQQMQQQQQQQSQQQQSHIPDNSSIEKMKALVPHLKKSLANLMRLAGESLRRDDIYASSSTTSSGSVEKALEEFFAICDQLEMQLGIALEGYNQVIQHKKYLNPEHLKYSFAPGQNTDVVQHYNAYSTVIRSQVALATSLHDALINCADQISAIPANSSNSAPTAPGASTHQQRPTQLGQPQPGTVFASGGIAGNASATAQTTATSGS